MHRLLAGVILTVWRPRPCFRPIRPARGDSRRRQADDQAAQVYVTFARLPEKVRSRVIGDIWDSTASADAIVKSTSPSPAT